MAVLLALTLAQARETFKRDVARYYLTSDWVPQLQEEILKTMGAHPY